MRDKKNEQQAHTFEIVPLPTTFSTVVSYLIISTDFNHSEVESKLQHLPGLRF